MAGAVLATLGSVIAVSSLSLIGIFALSLRLLSRHRVVMVLVALAAGTLLGDAFLHLLPEAAEAHGFSPSLGMLVLAGFLVMYILEAGLHWGHAHGEHLGALHDEKVHGEAPIAAFGWMNLVGDAVHNFLDGAVIATAYLIDTSVGVATTIAVAAHEIPQELGDFAVLVRAGMAPQKALLWNLASALVAVLGAVLVLLAPFDVEALERFAVPLIAGAFLYIAAADLIPELHHHSKNKDVLLILVGLLAGLGLMGLLLGLEDVLPA